MALYPQSTTARSGAERLITVASIFNASRNGWSGMLSVKAWSQNTYVPGSISVIPFIAPAMFQVVLEPAPQISTPIPARSTSSRQSRRRWIRSRTFSSRSTGSVTTMEPS